MTEPNELSCACGAVRFQVEKAPIMSVECHCNSCREAGGKMQELPGAPPVLEENGGTRFVLYRKDRVRILAGAERLAEFRLRPDSTTRRAVAGCCNSAVFLEFQNGHWLSVYGGLWPAGTLPPLELRTMISDLPAGTRLPDDVPNSKRQSVSFMMKLLGAWIAMGFRVPKVALGGGRLHI